MYYETRIVNGYKLKTILCNYSVSKYEIQFNIFTVLLIEFYAEIGILLYIYMYYFYKFLARSIVFEFYNDLVIIY